ALKRRYGIADDETVLLYVGRLTAVKGSPQLVEALPAVLRHHPQAHLVILGVGELAGPLSEQVRALGLEDRVTLRYEFVDGTERLTHYQLCDVAVFPSTYEPF